jgi:hypothetical protein
MCDYLCYCCLKIQPVAEFLASLSGARFLGAAPLREISQLYSEAVK